jgi:hypothetical protein
MSPSFWWVNQGKQYRYERAGNHVFAPATGGPASWANVGKLQKGDVLINYANKEIQAVAEVLQSPSIEPRPSVALEMKESHKPAGFEDRGYLASVRYYDLRTAIGRDEIEEDWRVAEMGPFDKRHMLKMQGGAYPLDERFVVMLRDEFGDRFAPGTPFFT